MAEENIEIAQKRKSDDDNSWIGGLIMIAVVVAAIWGLIHYNPTEEEHMEAIRDQIGEAVVSMAMDGESMSLGSMAALSKIKYHSLGVCSWTATKYRGMYRVTSIGILGWTQPLIWFE